MKIVVFAALVLFISSCSEPEKSESAALKEIQNLEDSLQKMTSSSAMDAELFKKTQKGYAKELISFYQTFPDSKNAAESLDKVQQLFSAREEYLVAAQWADTLINKYPKYKKRALVLESQAMAYDAFIQPRDSTAVRLYYSMLLNEFPALNKEKRKGIQRRLKYNALNFDEYIEFQMMNP